MDVNYRKLFIKHNVPYEVITVKAPNFKGTLIKKKKLVITKVMIDLLIKKMSINNFYDNRGHSHERRKKPCIVKLRKFMETL